MFLSVRRGHPEGRSHDGIDGVPKLCQNGAMNLSVYVDSLRHQLAVAADAGGDDARALAERLTAPLESATRLVLLEVLTAAADEITRELAPGAVEVRLRGRDPAFVVTPPPSDQAFDDERPTRRTRPTTGAVAVDARSEPGRTPPVEGEDGGMSRLNLRLPDALKLRIEEAARQEGLSLNTWLLRAAAAALEPDNHDRLFQRSPWGSQRYTGWVR